MTCSLGQINRYIDRANTVSIPVNHGGRNLIAFNEVDQRIANGFSPIILCRYRNKSWQILEDGLLCKVDGAVVGGIDTVGIRQ